LLAYGVEMGGVTTLRPKYHKPPTWQKGACIMTLPDCVPERTPRSSPPAVLSKARIAPREPAPASRLIPTPSLPLFARHLRELQEGSGIAPNLIAERGYGTSARLKHVL